MKKKVLMRKNARKMNAIQLLAKRLNHNFQLPENLDNYSIKDLELAENAYIEHVENSLNEDRSKEAENLEK